METIAIIGTGNVGTALGKGWSRSGHSIVYGASDTRSKSALAVLESVSGTRVAGVAEAANEAGIVVLAVPFDALSDVINACGDLQGKLVLDATNPLTFHDDSLELALGFSTSGGEQVAEMAVGADVFKTLNQVGFAVMSDTSGYASRPVMFVAGDNDRRKPDVFALVEDLGFEAREAGPMKAARLLEPYASLWIDQALKFGAPTDNAFGMLRRNGEGGTVECIRYELTSHTPEDLIAAYEEAGRHLREAPECCGYQLTQCEETPGRFILRICWTSSEAHLTGFRKGPHFPPFLELVRPFVPEISEMTHYSPTRVAWTR
ncbi:hypothetical protein FMN50_14570 [Rhodobacterales bacterium]|nr:hypothetical protein FMN50_14570 [Rhodobacterales bacterium]